MTDPRVKTFTVTLEMEAHTYEGIVRRIEKLVNDERTLSFSIEEQKEEK